MKTSTKLLLIFLLLILAISLFYNIRQEFRAIANAKKIAALSSAGNNGDAPIITRYIRNNTEHAVIKEYELRNDKPSVFIDSMKELLAIKEKQLLQATQVNAMLKSGNLLLKLRSDSLYEYQDKWLKLTYTPESNSIDLNYALTLSTVKYWKRKWFLAPKAYYIDVFSDDPRVTIENVKRFTIETSKPKKFGIGLNVGYGYGFASNQWQPYIGAGLSYNLIRF